MNDRQKIIIQAFGLQNVAQQINIGAGVSARIAGQNIETSVYKSRITNSNPQDIPMYTSSLGTPIWDTLIIKGGTYADQIYGQISYNEMRIDSCLITLSQAHNVVLTAIQGRDGEVVEYVGKASFRLNIKGGIFGTGNVRPKSEIINLANMLGSNEPLSVKSCSFLSEWNISDFDILDKNIPQSMGGYSYQLFEFSAIQDLPVILAQSPNNA